MKKSNKWLHLGKILKESYKGTGKKTNENYLIANQILPQFSTETKDSRER